MPPSPHAQRLDSYDIVAATSKRGDKFLSVPLLRALAAHKKVDGCGSLVKKDDLIDTLRNAFSKEAEEFGA